MTACDLLRQDLEAAVAGELDPELARHLEECADCRDAVRRAARCEEGGAMLHIVRAPAELKAKLKAMARLPHECEQALEWFSPALDGELDAAGQRQLLGHLRDCRTCQAAWEAMATLREVGSLTQLPKGVRHALAVHPRERISVRRRRRPFDLRLVTAAAYLLAALTVLLIGNPAQIAKASNVPVERAAVYTRAAVENRFDSLTRRLRAGASAVCARAGDLAEDAWHAVRDVFGRTHENRKPSGNVVPDGNGGPR